MKSPVATMTLVFLLGSTLSVTEAKDFFDQLRDAVGKVVGAGCAAVTGVKATATCNVKYTQAIAPLLGVDDQSTDMEKIRGTVKYCCALSALRSCVLNEIRETCGEAAEQASREIVSKIAQIESGKLDSEDAPCTGKEAQYASASPLCWPESAQYTAIVILCGLVLLSCGVCFLRKCFR